MVKPCTGSANTNYFCALLGQNFTGGLFFPQLPFGFFPRAASAKICSTLNWATICASSSSSLERRLVPFRNVLSSVASANLRRDGGTRGAWRNWTHGTTLSLGYLYDDVVMVVEESGGDAEEDGGDGGALGKWGYRAANHTRRYS